MFISRVHAEASTRPRVDKTLRDEAALGLTVCRMWAFNNDISGAAVAVGRIEHVDRGKV